MSAFAATRSGSWLVLHVANPIDRRLLPATGGRVSLTPGLPVLCLEVTGAKSGKLRRTPLLLVEVDDQLVVIASATGIAKHPAWYHNVRASPHVKVYAPGGRTGEYVARIVEEDTERERMWNAAREIYKGYDVYEERTSGLREIPVVALRRE